MGSVTFSAIGQAAGGPLGAIVGAIAGASVDRALARSGRAQAGGGPMLLRSGYGEPIPRLYGRCRTGGILIWATPVSRGGGGKGGGRRAYVASFAIALSARPIRRVRSIWADGRQILDDSGRMDPPFVMRVHDGGGRWAADPLMMAVEGVDQTPAYRHLAWAVFEQFPLGPFGNRIPSMSFEIEADPADGDAADWLADLAGSAGLTTDPDPASFRGWGFPARGDRLREDVETLALVAGQRPGERSGRQCFRADSPPVTIEADHILAEEDTAVAALSRTSGVEEGPRRALLSYLDPAREFQPSEQRVGAEDGGPALILGSELVMEAGEARTLAAALLRERMGEVDELQIRLPWRWIHLGCGDSIRIGDRPETWRIQRRRIEGLLLSLSCVRAAAPDRAGPMPADPGRSLPAATSPPGPTTLGLFDPPAGLPGSGLPGLLVLAAGGPAWREVPVEVRIGAVQRVAVGVPGRSVSGQLETVLQPGPSWLWDEKARPVVALDWEDQWLQSRSARDVLAGGGRMIVGNEVIQYRLAEPLGDRRYRLRGLLRGVDGSDGLDGTHPPGTRIWVVGEEPAVLPLGPGQIGEQVEAVAQGSGDPPDGTRLAISFEGRSAAAFAPCHIRASRAANGDLAISWIPRRREDLLWRAEGDTPDGWFLMEIRVDGLAPAIRRLRGTGFAYPLAAQIADFGAPLAEFVLRLTAEGDGPLAMRRSAMLALSL